MSARTPMRTRINGGWEPDRAALLEELYQFALIMRGAPVAIRSGLRGVSAFALSLRRAEPDVVFEVGVWRGFGT